MTAPLFIEAVTNDNTHCYINMESIDSIDVLDDAPLFVRVYTNRNSYDFTNKEAEKFIAYAKNQAYDPNHTEARKISYDVQGRPVKIEAILKSYIKQDTAADYIKKEVQTIQEILNSDEMKKQASDAKKLIDIIESTVPPSDPQPPRGGFF